VGVSGWPHVSVYGNQTIVIWSGKRRDFFPGEKGLIRIGTNKPIQMKYTAAEGGGLIPAVASGQNIVRQLLKNSYLNIRYVSWPSRETSEQTVNLWMFHRLYRYVARDCGWPQHEDIRTPGRKFKLVDHGKGRLADKRVRIDGNPWIGIDVSGGSCELGVISDELVSRNLNVEKGGMLLSLGYVTAVFANKGGNFGFVEDSLSSTISSSSYNPQLSILDAEFNSIFTAALSKGNATQQAKNAAQTAWRMSPSGYLRLRAIGGGLVPLAGFRNLYQWAADHCGYPKFQ